MTYGRISRPVGNEYFIQLIDGNLQKDVDIVLSVMINVTRETMNSTACQGKKTVGWGSDKSSSSSPTAPSTTHRSSSCPSGCKIGHECSNEREMKRSHLWELRDLPNNILIRNRAIRLSNDDAPPA